MVKRSELSSWDRFLGVTGDDVQPSQGPVSSQPPSPELLAMRQMVRQQRWTNFWLIMQILLRKPGHTIMGLFIIYLVVHSWLFG